MKTWTTRLLLWLAVFLPVLAAAQDFPSRPLRIVVPYPPGGAGDMHSRLVAQKLSATLGQQVIVENRAGASGNIGSDHVAKSPPDGHTILFATTNLAINHAANAAKVPFNVLTDLLPVSMSLTSQNLIAVRPTLPVRNIAELVAYAKANPGKLSFGSSGVGSPWLGMELLKTMAGINMVHVPYKGDAPAITDLMGGQIDLYATNVSALDAHHRSGKLRGIAVTSRKRSSSLPDIATVDESGVPGYELESWFGFMVPAGTPRPIVDRLNAALVQIIGMPDVQKAMLDVGLTPATSTPEAYAARIRADVDKFTRIITASGIKID
ncbi:MAG: tripartite tricarboxylate transporter substrate binding protein [Betaproteobacteria bacterium]